MSYRQFPPAPCSSAAAVMSAEFVPLSTKDGDGGATSPKYALQTTLGYSVFYNTA